MGVVYSSKEIASAAVPQNGAHLEVAQTIIDEIPEIEGVELTTVYGSVVDEDKQATLRSDLDVLITYLVDGSGSEYMTLSQIREIIDQVESQHHVKVEPNIWVANESMRARTQRMHDRLFSKYLVNAMQNSRWSIGGGDNGIIEISEAPLSSEQLRDIVLQYLAYKHKGITIAPLGFDDGDKAVKSLQRVLELPKALGRKVGQLCVLFEDEEQDLFGHIASQNGLIHSLTELGVIDKEYTEYIEKIALQIHELQPRDIEEYRRYLVDRYKKVMPLGLAAIRGFTEVIDTEKELVLAR